MLKAIKSKTRKLRHFSLEYLLKGLQLLLKSMPSLMIDLLQPSIWLLFCLFGIPSHLKAYQNLRQCYLYRQLQLFPQQSKAFLGGHPQCLSLLLQCQWSLTRRFLSFLSNQPLKIPYTQRAELLIKKMAGTQAKQPYIFILTHFGDWELIAVDLVKKGIALNAITAYHAEQPLSRALKNHRFANGLKSYHQGDIKQILELGQNQQPLLFVTDLLGLNQKSLAKHKFKPKNRYCFLGKHIPFTDIPDRLAERLSSQRYAILPCYFQGQLFIDIQSIDDQQSTCPLIYQSLEALLIKEPKAIPQWIWMHDLYEFPEPP